MLTDPAPLIFAFGASILVSLVAWRLRALSASGAVAATIVGGAALRASWGMGLYLIAWFALAALLSRVGKAKKAARVSDVVEKSSQRDAWQVLANGGVYFVCSLVVIFAAQAGFAEQGYELLFAFIGAGSLAAAGADTWATEIGTLVGGAPRSLRTFSRVPVGTSGAISIAGTLATIAGAVVLATIAYGLKVIQPLDPRPMVALAFFACVATAGVAGAFVDTALGAWLQERRWCPRCTTETEQRTHLCGTPTVHHRGMKGLTNDWVNFVCSLTGAIVPVVLLLALTLYIDRG